jgi:UrcA family protein
MNTTSTSRFAVKAMALGLAIITVNAIASLPGFAAERSMKVQTSDLNLKTEQGAATLYRRLKVTSSLLCGATSPQSLERRTVWLRCYNRTLQDAVTSINEPELLAIYHQQRGDKANNAG